jgi:hypothetical protein
MQHLELQEIDALTSATIQPATLQQIGSLTKLTYLYIQRLDSVQADTWEVANVLQCLSQLRGLRLWAAGPWPQRRGQQQQQQQQRAAPTTVLAAEAAAELLQPPAAAADAAEYAAAASEEDCGKAGLTSVIASLPHLESLSLSLQGLGSTAAAELGAATGLTSLKLRACGIGSAALAGLAADLKGLRSLFMEYNRQVGDDVLPVLLQQLTELTELDVRYTGVSDAGRQYLQQLTRLQQLQL